jgi:hypothetical protein
MLNYLCPLIVLLAVCVAAWFAMGHALRAAALGWVVDRLLTAVVRLALRAGRRPPIILAMLILAVIGCDSQPPRVRALPAPPPERPVCNLPASLHIRNWPGPKGEGSCVHASLKNHAAWHNDFEFIRNWPYADGETATRVRQRLDSFGYDYGYTEKYDSRFLDWCNATGHGAILWWKPSHCCTFMGWVKRDGKVYAAILDNNYPGEFQLTEREQFIRLWSGYGGFALCFMKPPTIANPFKSYEVY